MFNAKFKCLINVALILLILTVFNVIAMHYISDYARILSMSFRKQVQIYKTHRGIMCNSAVVIKIFNKPS